MKKYWNHRVLAFKYSNEVWFEMHEVYYENDVPTSYTEKPLSVSSYDLKGIKWTLNKMKLATKKPILWGGVDFPEEFNGTKSESITN